MIEINSPDKSNFCQGHSDWSWVQHRWDTNQLFCCTCQKEIKNDSEWEGIKSNFSDEPTFGPPQTVLIKK